MISIRASSTPLLCICPRSQEPTALRIDTDRQDARLGTASHDGAATYLRDAFLPVVKELAEKHGVDDVDELAMMLAFAKQAIDALRETFPEPILEQNVAIMLADDVELTGTADILSILDERVVVGDYKSGRRHRDYIKQLLSYALLACLIYDKTKWSVSLIWLRDHYIDTKSGGLDELMQHKEELIAAARVATTAPFRVGEHCLYCPRAHDCPARQQLVKQSARDLMDADIKDFVELAASGRLPAFWAGIKCIEKSIIDIREQLKLTMNVHGDLVCPDGTVFTFDEIVKRALDPLKSWPVLQQRLSDEEIAGSMRFSLTDLQDAVAKKVGRGQKGKAKEELVEALDAAGAIERKTEKRLALKKA
jgi:hypothetical protein